jgi:hypothetical protein
MGSLITAILMGLLGAAIGGAGSLLGRLAYDHWLRFLQDFDYAASLFLIPGAVIGGAAGAITGAGLAARSQATQRTFRWILVAEMVICLLVAGALALYLNPYWIATHWGNRSYLVGANLAHANLRGANLTGANLYGADLTGAILSDADLRAATLSHAEMRGADLRGANMKQQVLVAAELDGADLTGVRYDARTEWPADFDPARHGAVKVEDAGR